MNKNKIPLQTPFYYGWVIVFIGGLGIFFSGPGQTYSNSVFIESYIADLNLDRTTVSTVYAAATLTAGFLLFGIGKLVDRFGIRTMLVAVSIMLAIACFWNSMVMGPLMLFIGFFMIRLFGQGSLTLIPNTLVSQWFIKKRGRALSFAGLGALLSAAAFPPLIHALIVTYDWQFAWRVLGILLIVLFVPLCFFFTRNTPEEVGLLPDGVLVSDQQEQAMISEVSWTLKEAMSNRTFWLLITCSIVPAMVNTGITFQLFSILEEREISRTATAFLLSLVPLVSFPCSLVSGFLAERMKANSFLGITFLISLISPALLLMIHSYAWAIAFAVTWGIAQGMMNVPLRSIWPAYYGRKYLGSINSVTTAAMVIGSALGPIPFGYIFDRFGSYDLTIIMSLVLWATGAILAFLAIQPTKKIG